MKVWWNYDNTLSFAHTPDETDDETAYVKQTITPAELIVHAANLHLFKSGALRDDGLPLWSLGNARPEPSLPMAPSSAR